jgi:hypothetical protein
MLSRLKNRRKSVGAESQADANGAVGMPPKSGKRSFLDFFRPSRRRRKVEKDDAIAAGGDSIPKSVSWKTSPQNVHGMSLPLNVVEDDAATSKPAAPATSPSMSATPTDNLTEEDIQQLFSGAPYFSASSVAGQIQPSISFPWDLELKTRGVSDSKRIPHAAFSGATLYQHLPIVEATDLPNRGSITYDIGVKEIPSMLAATGTQRGTVGLEFFVQEPEADMLNLNAREDNPDDVFENFSNFELLESQPEKLGIRKFDFSSVAERLAELSTIYESTREDERAFSILNHTSSGELYAALFGKVLTPPKYDSSAMDPTGLKVQVETLLRILNLKRVWYDFSNVEWRIRVGQLVFTDIAPDLSDSNVSEPEEGLIERDVVLLQLLLSCELYTRLEAVASLSTQEVKGEMKLTGDEVLNFRNMESRKTKWDLVLARRFLENVDAKTYMRAKLMAQSEKSLTRSILGMAQRESTIKIDELDIAFEPRRQDLQLKGLFYFAEAIRWPDCGTLQDHLIEALASHEGDEQVAESPSIYATPLSTPGTLTPRSFRSNRESGYFGATGSVGPEMTPRSFQLQSPSTLDLEDSLAANNGNSRVSIGGWLTRSYLTGLIMPGEAICHLLISSILENDAESIIVLGENANLYGGFVYKNRSFWSKCCVVGRVLACLDDSKECMGWISSSIIPAGFGDGWLDIYSTPIQLTKIDMDGDSLAKNTDLLAGKEVGSVKFAEFTLPQDQPVIPKGSLRFERLTLQPVETPPTPVIGEDPALSASLEFTLDTDAASAETYSIPLLHLVQLISAFPCIPPQLSATKRVATTDHHEETIKLAPAHPLHVSYHYRRLHATALLDATLDIEDSESSSVIVIDARGDSQLELLARTWCFSEGFNALVARVGVTCLSCAIRETRGLDVRVLIRVGEVES